MDSIRVSEAPDPGSIPGEATNFFKGRCKIHDFKYQKAQVYNLLRKLGIEFQKKQGII